MLKRETKRTIDQTYNALRPRLKGLAGGNGSVTVIAPPHTHAASQITFDPNEPDGGFISAFDVQTGMEELDTDKLARSGAQPMLGALDMNHFDVDNVNSLEVEVDATVGNDLTVIGGDATVSAGDVNITAGDLVFAGAIGSAKIQNPRAIEMEGDATDDEAKIMGLERLLFNDTDGYSVIDQVRRTKWAVDGDDVADYGDEGWDSTEKILTVATELASWDDGMTTGTANTRLPWGWRVTKHVWTGGMMAEKGMVVQLSTTDADYVTGGFPRVEPFAAAGLVGFDLENARRVIGLALHRASADQPIWILRTGRILPVNTIAGAASGAGQPIWADPNVTGGLTFDEPTNGQYARILVGHLAIYNGGEGPFWMDVDIQVRPTIMGASWVKSDESPQNLDVLRYDANDLRWERRQLFPSQIIDFDYTLLDTDYLVRCVADSGPFTVFLPAPSAVTGAVFVIRRDGDAGDSITIDASTNGGTIEGENTFELLFDGESITVQSDGSTWAVI